MTLPYPRISPEIFRLGPLVLRWYGVMYLVAYAVGIGLVRARRRRGLVPFDDQALDVWVGYLVIGMLVGARLLYVLVYNPGHFAEDPWDAIAIWHGGLSFHGALLGMIVASFVFARRHHVSFAVVADTLALAGPPGLFFGRIGNFINAELYGRPTNVPWAMIFPTDPYHVPRHPSQLYEALCEGLLLFGILRVLEGRAVGRGWYRPGLLAGAFLIGYGVIRFLIEFTRQPDAQLGLVVGPFSMGQLLCALMIASGVVVLALVYSRRPGARSAVAEMPEVT